MFSFWSADCGAGKTQKLIEYISNRNTSNDKFIVAASTIGLLEQTRSALLQSINAFDVLLISSTDLDYTPKQLDEAIALGTGVILCTEKTLFRSSADLSAYEIFMDDISEIHSYRSYTARNEVLKGIFSSYLIPKVFNEKIVDVQVQKSRDYAFKDLDARMNITSGYDKLLVPSLDYLKIQNGTGEQFALLQLWDIKKLSTAKKVTFISANFKDTFVYQFNRDLFIEEFPVFDKRLQHPKDRVKLFYFKDSSISLQLIREKPQLLEGILEFISAGMQSMNKECLFTTNNLNSSFSYPGMIGIKPKAMGLNIYMHYEFCAWLVSEKFHPREIQDIQNIIHEKFTAIDHLKAREFRDMYQFISRSNIRDFSSTKEVTIFVMDKQQAQYIQEQFQCTAQKIDGVWDTIVAPLGRPTIADIDEELKKKFIQMKKNLSRKKLSALMMFKALHKWIDEQPQKDLYLGSKWVQENIKRTTGL